MAKFIDRITIAIVCFILATMWCLYFSGNFILSLILGTLIAIPFLLSWIIGKNFAQNRHTMSVTDMLFYLAIMGQVEQTALFASTLVTSKIYGKSAPFIMLKKENTLTLVFVNYKFGKTLKDEIARCYRKAKELNATEVILLGNTDRSVIATSRRLDIPFRYPSLYDTKRHLVKHNALPQTITPHKSSPSISINDIPKIISSILHRSHAKHYIFVGLLLALTSFITPLKIYYLTTSSILILTGIACLIFGDK
ncbi:MAG: hypothetical protein R3Y23_00875 [Bacillota bacterium]